MDRSLDGALTWLAWGLAVGLPVGLLLYLVAAVRARRARPPSGPPSGPLVLCLILLTAAALAALSPAAATSNQASAPRLKLLAQHGGEAGAIVQRGGWAYLAEGSRVVAVDLSRPEAPRRAGRSPELPGVVRRLEGWEGRLLALYRDSLAQAGGDGLAVLRADGAAITVEADWPLPFGPQDLAVSGKDFWLTGFDAARGQTLAARDLLAVLSAQPPGDAPPLMARLDLREAGLVPTSPAPLSVLGDGGVIWLLRTLRGGAQERTEVSSFPSQLPPAEGGQHLTELVGRHSGAAANQQGLLALALLEAGRGRVRLSLLTPSTEVTERGSLELVALRGCGGPLAIAGTLAAYADRCERRLRLIDIADPDAPRLLGSVAIDVAAGALSWQDGSSPLLVSGGPMGGLVVVDVAQPDRPTVTARLEGLGAVQRLALDQGEGRPATLYGVDPAAGLWLIDPAAAAGDGEGGGDPLRLPVPLAAPRIELPQAANLALLGEQLVVGGWSEGLRPFSLADPRAPKALPILPQAKAADWLLALGPRLVEGLGNAGLAAIELQPDGSLAEGASLQQPLIWQLAATAEGRLIGQGQGFAYEIDPVSLAPINRWTLPAPSEAFKVNRADSIAADGDQLHLAVAGYTHNPSTLAFADRLLSLRLPAGTSAAEALAQRSGGLGGLAGRVLAGDGLVLAAGDAGVTLLRAGADAPEPRDRWASPGSGSDLARWRRDCPAGAAGCHEDLVLVADGEGGLAVLAVEAGGAGATPTATGGTAEPTEGVGRWRCYLPWGQRRR